jgi:hypothetical protein
MIIIIIILHYPMISILILLVSVILPFPPVTLISMHVHTAPRLWFTCLVSDLLLSFPIYYYLCWPFPFLPLPHMSLYPFLICCSWSYQSMMFPIINHLLMILSIATFACNCLICFHFPLITLTLFHCFCLALRTSVAMIKSFY